MPASKEVQRNLANMVLFEYRGKLVSGIPATSLWKLLSFPRGALAMVGCYYHRIGIL